LNEIRIFYSSIQSFALGNIKLFKIVSDKKLKICYRCKNEDPSMNCFCLNCKRATYCNNKCMNKNLVLHAKICRFYMEKGAIVNSMLDKTMEYFVEYEKETKEVNLRKNRDKDVIKKINDLGN
jgi:hypothetical protein